MKKEFISKPEQQEAFRIWKMKKVESMLQKS
jgi:hypothetical protein